MKKLLVLMLLLSATVVARAVMVTVTVGEGGNFFKAPAFTIDPGDTIRWVWVSGHHNTQSMTYPAGALPWYSDIDMSTTSFIYVPTVSGLYRYTCTHHSGMDAQFFVSGCSYPAKPTVTGPSVTGICFGDTVTLRTVPQKGITYQWVDGVSIVPDGNSDSLRVHTSGNYKVVVNRCGVDSVSDVFKVVVNPLPVPSFTFHESSPGQFGFINTTTDVAASAYRWQFGNGAPDQTTTDATLNFTASGTYTVTLKATHHTTGCVNDTLQTIKAGLSIGALAGDGYRIYPNPANNEIYIQSLEKATVQIRDIRGRLLDIPLEHKGKAIRADISTLKSGLYFLCIRSLKGCTMEKIMVTD